MSGDDWRSGHDPETLRIFDEMLERGQNSPRRLVVVPPVVKPDGKLIGAASVRFVSSAEPAPSDPGMIPGGIRQRAFARANARGRPRIESPEELAAARAFWADYRKARGLAAPDYQRRRPLGVDYS